jgi:hypothetical protein
MVMVMVMVLARGGDDDDDNNGNRIGNINGDGNDDAGLDFERQPQVLQCRKAM